MTKYCAHSRLYMTTSLLYAQRHKVPTSTPMMRCYQASGFQCVFDFDSCKEYAPQEHTIQTLTHDLSTRLCNNVQPTLIDILILLKQTCNYSNDRHLSMNLVIQGQLSALPS